MIIDCSVDAPFLPGTCPKGASFLHPVSTVISACVPTLPPFCTIFVLFPRYLFLPLKYVYEYFNCFTDILVDLFFFDILLQYVSECIVLKSRKTGVSNRGRMVPGSWVVVGMKSNVDSCFLALCPNTTPYNTPVC